jgi:hypothetical protein
MFVSGFNFFYSYFVYLHFIFLFLCVYLFSIFFFKKILVFLICFIIKIIKQKLLYFCLIRCRFEVWKKKTNLIFFSSMVFFLFLLLSVLSSIF